MHCEARAIVIEFTTTCAGTRHNSKEASHVILIVRVIMNTLIHLRQK